MSSRRSRPPQEPDDTTGAPVAVVRSGELFAPVSPGIELCYQTFGDPDGDPLLLVMGLSGPMTWWDDDFCERLVRVGFFVVRFDNRDIGRSSRGKGRVPRNQLVRGFLGTPARPPYSLADMAGDTFGLMDHLGLASAHLAGISMGGMIAQTMAITQPSRVRSLASIMSTTGKRSVGWQHPVMLRQLLTGGGTGRDAYIKTSILTWRTIGSPDYPMSKAALTAKAGETFDRGVSLSGLMRQMAAVVTQPNRTERLHALRVPTVVIHGLADKMVHVSGGRATAQAIPDAELLLFEGMGHDLPSALFDEVVAAIRRTADRAAAAPTS